MWLSSQQRSSNQPQVWPSKSASLHERDLLLTRSVRTVSASVPYMFGAGFVGSVRFGVWIGW